MYILSDKKTKLSKIKIKKGTKTTFEFLLQQTKNISVKCISCRMKGFPKKRCQTDRLTDKMINEGGS